MHVDHVPKRQRETGLTALVEALDVVHKIGECVYEAERVLAERVRADRLDAVVWASLYQLLRTPSVIPTLHQSWAQAKQHTLTAL